MTLKTQLEKSLSNLLKQQTGSAAVTLTVSNTARTVSLEIDFITLENIGSTISEIRFVCQSLQHSTDTLKTWAQDLSDRISYLMESLGLIEIDAQNGTALVRSKTPTQSQNSRDYFEMLLELNKRGGLSLKRYRYRTGNSQRIAVEMCLTHEVLYRLAEDLEETAPVGTP